MWPFNNSDNSDEQDTKEEREQLSEHTAVRWFTRYRVEIEYRGERDSETKYANKYKMKDNHVELYDQKPYLSKFFKGSSSLRDIPSRHYPTIQMKELGPTVISLSNVNNIEIEEDMELVAAVEDIEIETVERRESPDDEWEEHYQDLPDDFDADDYDEPTIWEKPEWEFHQNS
jgi:hypothetical protein